MSDYTMGNNLGNIMLQMDALTGAVQGIAQIMRDQYSANNERQNAHDLDNFKLWYAGPTQVADTIAEALHAERLDNPPYLDYAVAQRVSSALFRNYVILDRRGVK